MKKLWVLSNVYFYPRQVRLRILISGENAISTPLLSGNLSHQKLAS
jgi:hypothetical protein